MTADPAEQLLATFPAESDEARTIRHLIGYRTEYEALQRELATPPEGWFAFGHHVTQENVPRLEFWGDHAGLPLWERPVPDADPIARLAAARAAFDGRAAEIAPQDDLPFIQLARTALGIGAKPWLGAQEGTCWHVEYVAGAEEGGRELKDGPHWVYTKPDGNRIFSGKSSVLLDVDSPHIRHAWRLQ